MVLLSILRGEIYWLSVVISIGYITILFIFGKQEFHTWFPIYLTLLIYDFMDYFLEQVPSNTWINRTRADYGIYSYKFEDTLLSWLFGGDLPSHYFLTHHHIVLDIIFGFIYILTVLTLGIFILYVRLNKFEYFYRISFAAILTAIVTSIIFYLFPTPPPWFLYYYGVDSPLNVSIDRKYAAGGLWFIEQEFDFIPITGIMSKLLIFSFGSFPSIHIIVACNMFLYLNHMKSKYRYYALLLFTINCVGVVYLAHHYVADVIGGILLSFIVVKFSLKGFE